MKKLWLLSVLWLAVLALAGCNCKCNNETDEDEILNERIAYCNGQLNVIKQMKYLESWTVRVK